MLFRNICSKYNLAMAFSGFLDDFGVGSEESQAEFLSTEFLEHCFFIFDEAGQDESMEAEEISVYFYPEQGLDLHKQLLLEGSISAMIVYATQFNPTESVRVLALSRAKFAIKKVGQFTIVVTGRADEGDGVLQRYVEALYQGIQGAFIFCAF